MSTSPRELEAERRGVLAALGATISPVVRDGTYALYAPLQPVELDHKVVRDVPYGPHPLQTVDIHVPTGGGTNLPVFCYVHGGGFVAGDKGAPGEPFYDNVGRWAVEEGMIGVNVNYRLAPDVVYPAGAQDIGSMLALLSRSIAEYGGDPDWVVVMGHSAGAAHVASAVAWPELREAGSAPAGAVLSSGAYDPTAAGGANAVYYGSDPEALAAAASIPGLCTTDVPLLVTTAEFDPPQFQRYSADLLGALVAAKGALPDFAEADGHNHFSVAMHLGTEQRWFGDRLCRFVDKVAPRR